MCDLSGWMYHAPLLPPLCYHRLVYGSSTVTERLLSARPQAITGRRCNFSGIESNGNQNEKIEVPSSSSSSLENASKRGKTSLAALAGALQSDTRPLGNS
nr:hypothetical protein CFP56_23814 [Quercus suber]